MSRIWSNADIAIIKAEVLGTTLRWKVWKSTETEPVSWTYSTTDSSITSPGYIGLYEGWNNGGAASSVSAIDDMYWGVTGTSFATTSVVNNDVIPVNNSAWIAGLSPYTWYTFGSSYILADNPGAYFKVKFTGTSVSLGVDVSAMSGISLPAKQYPRIAYQIDGGTWQTYQLKSTDSLVSLGSSLSDTTHDLEVLYLSSDAYTARWNGTMSLKITNLTLDVGKTLSAATLLPKKMLIFGDSITEGAWVLGDHTDLTNYSNYEVATSSYAVGVANDLNAEYGNAAFGGEAWGSSFNSDIPQFTSAWNYYFSTNSRLSGGLLSPAPDYVLINMGANGGLSSGSVASSLLSSLRVATGSSTKIFIMVPFNGTGRTNITSGFNSYQTSFSDSNTFLIDLGSAGATYADTISTYSFDGLHPNLAGHAQLRTITSAAIQNAIQNIPTLPTVSTPSTSNILLDGVILNSAISSDGNASSTIEGFNYGTTAAYGSVASSTGTFGIGSFSQNISGLVCGTAYHFQAFATNSIGTGTSSDQTFNTNVCVIASIPAVVSSNQTSSSGGSAYSQINNLLAMGNYALAQQIAKQYGLSIPTQNIPRNVALDAPSAGGQQFTRTLRVGATSSDVKKLQIFLNAQGFTVAKKGAGSPGHETTTFGPATKAALMKFQSAHKKETLDPQGLKAPTGFFGIDTKKAVNALVK
jgi:lysophospholipase L1-like esterase